MQAIIWRLCLLLILSVLIVIFTDTAIGLYHFERSQALIISLLITIIGVAFAMQVSWRVSQPRLKEKSKRDNLL